MNSIQQIQRRAAKYSSPYTAARVVCNQYNNPTNWVIVLGHDLKAWVVTSKEGKILEAEGYEIIMPWHLSPIPFKKSK